MDEKKLRKQLTILTYSFLFKRFLPTMEGTYKIGNIEYAAKLNQLIRQRKLNNYSETVFSDFRLIVSNNQDSKHNIASNNPVNDNNFNNWINGTSNPKSYEIINALIEYVEEVAQAPEKLMQLRFELVSIISHESFSLYTEGLLRANINAWSEALMNEPDRIEVILILKEVLYLLKDKTRNLSVLIQSKMQATSEIVTDILTEADLSFSENTLQVEAIPEQRNAPVLQQKSKRFRRSVVWGSLSFVFVFIIFISANAFLSKDAMPNHETASTKPIDRERIEDPEISLSPSIEIQELNEMQEIPDMQDISSLPTNENLAMPTVHTPKNDTVIPYEDLQIEWDPLPNGTSCIIMLKDVKTDKILFEESDIKESQFTLSQKYFLHGQDLVLYLITKKDLSSSDAAVVSFSIEDLVSPVFLEPESSTNLSFNDHTVTWTPIEDSDTYHVIVTDIERWVNVFDKSYIEETYCTLNQSIFIPGKTYRIYVASQNSSVESVPNYLDIQIDPLASPLITSHSGSTEILYSPIELVWEPVQNASSYHIDILDTNTWEEVLNVDELRTTSYTLDPTLFTLGASYRLYLFADLGISSSAPTYLDLSTTELTPPTIKEPINNALLPLENFLLQWEKNPLAKSYKVVITDTFSWEPVLTEQNILANELMIDKSYLTLGRPYRIYVKSMIDEVESAPNIIDIQIQGLPIPEILTPKSGTEYEDQEIRIEWKPSSYITTYKVTVTDLTTWTTIYQNDKVLGEELILERDLFQSGTSYRIYVQSIQGSSESEPDTVDFLFK